MKPGTAETEAKDSEPEIKTGVRLANEKYFTLTRIEDSITFRKGSDGALFVKTNQAILVAIYRQPIQAQEALVVVEHYAGYLKANGI
jgi:profilin